MIISLKELELIASTPENECFICNDILYQIEINEEGKRYIPEIYFKRNPDVREHLKQIIGK